MQAIDIVLPCFNPSQNWEVELIGFYNRVHKLYIVNFIIVNDGSDEIIINKGVARLKELKIPFQFISYSKNQGKGYALRKGISVSKNRFAIYTDIDFPFINESVINVIDSLVTSNYDIVAGHRDSAYYENNISFFRKILSKAFRFFIKNMLSMSITDTQCGLKGLNEIGKAKFLTTRINRYLFDFEFIYISTKDNSIRISPISVELKDNVVFSKMKLKILAQELLNLISILVFKKSNL